MTHLVNLFNVSYLDGVIFQVDFDHSLMLPNCLSNGHSAFLSNLVLLQIECY